jgi:hypothetical protein
VDYTQEQAFQNSRNDICRRLQEAAQTVSSGRENGVVKLFCLFPELAQSMAQGLPFAF